MWYAVANAASHWIVNPLIAALAPRSSCSHWGSLKADDQRVVASPSTAARGRRAGVLGRGGGRLGAERDVDVRRVRGALRREHEEACDEGEGGGRRETARQLSEMHGDDRQVSDPAPSCP